MLENDYKLIGNYYYKKTILTKLNLNNVETDAIIDIFKLSDNPDYIPTFDLSSLEDQNSLNKAIKLGFILRKTDNQRLKSKDTTAKKYTKDIIIKQEPIIIPELKKEVIVTELNNHVVTPIRFIDDNKYIVKGNLKYEVETLKKKLGNEYILFLSKLNNMADNKFINPLTRLIILNENKKLQIMQTFKIEKIELD